MERGVGVRTQPFVRLRVTDGGRCRLDDGVALDRGVDLTVQAGRLHIGPRSYVGQFSVLVARQSIAIGADCLIAEHVTIRDQDHRVNAGKITAQNGFEFAEINIGNNVWIGSHCTITKGVRIGDNSVIGAGAVVTRDIPPDVIAAGVPAKVIRQIGK